MIDNVVGIRKGQALATREPNANAIKVLESALERAKSGDLIGIAMVGYAPGGATMWVVAGIHGRASIGAIEIMKVSLVMQDIKEDDDAVEG